MVKPRRGRLNGQTDLLVTHGEMRRARGVAS